LIGAAGNIVGFEFRAAPEMQRRLAQRADPVAQSAHAAALLGSAQWIAQGHRIGLARVPADWIVHAPALALGPGTMVALEHRTQTASDPDLASALARCVTGLRSQGVKVGWEVLLGLELTPDFVLLRQGSDPMSTLLTATLSWPAVSRGAPIVVTDIVDVRDLEAALRGGAAMACSALTAAQLVDDRVPARAVPPELQRVGQLLQQLSTGVDTAIIVSDIKGDVGLSYRLLCRIQNARFAHLQACASIEQAVLMLGRNELYRWLSMLLVQFAGIRPASSALQEVTLWRSRLLELMALRAGETAPNQLFTLGLASMLAPLLGIRMHDVVGLLALPGAAVQALIDHSGPWQVYLDVAEAVEHQTPELAQPLLDAFGGWDSVLELSAQAWTWAADTAGVDAPDAASTPVRLRA
jgi:EAL and modified HD-GYP domain-containing signal transduction protein